MTSDTDAASLTVRRAEPADGDGMGDVWLSAWRVTYDFPPGHPDEDVRRWLVEHLVPTHETWVAVDGRERVVALMALSATMVEQLYVAPDWIGRGLGSRLLDMAKTRRPGGLELWTFQANRRARQFYERHGFVEVERTDGSRNEERQPDLRYAWRPAPSEP